MQGFCRLTDANIRDRTRITHSSARFTEKMLSVHLVAIAARRKNCQLGFRGGNNGIGDLEIDGCDIFVYYLVGEPPYIRCPERLRFIVLLF